MRWLRCAISRRRWLVEAIAAALMWAFICASAAAATPSGTRISVSAYAYYMLDGSVVSSRSESAAVYITVAAQEALTLSGATQVRMPLGATNVTLPFVLTNTGNVAADYTFAAANGTGCSGSSTMSLSALTIYRDVGSTGFVTNGATALGATDAVHLGAGETTGVLVTGTAPTTSTSAQACASLTAVSNGQQMRASAQTAVVTGGGAVISLRNTGTASSVLTNGTGSMTYTLAATNTGERAATPTATAASGATPILVNGVAASYVLLRNPIPTGVTYVMGSLQSQFPSAVKLYRLPVDPAFSYRTGGDDSSAVEVAVGLPSISPGATASMSFTTNANTTAGNGITDQGWIDFADGSSSRSVVSNVVAYSVIDTRLGVALAAGTAHAQASGGVADGTAIVHMTAHVRNYGTVPLFNVQISNPLEGSGSTQFGTWTAQTVPGTNQYTVVANSIKVSGITTTGVVASANTGYTGRSGADGLLAAGAVLPVGADFTVEYDVRINFTGRASTVYANATATAALSANAATSVSDASANGTDPDPAGTGKPQSQSSPTPVAPPPTLSGAVTAGQPKRVAQGVYDIAYHVTVNNIGSVAAAQVRVFDNLDCAIKQSTNGAVSAWSIVSKPVAKNGLLTVSSTYTGTAACDSPIDVPTGSPISAVLSMTDGQSGLLPGQTEEIDFTVRVTLAQTLGGSTVITNAAYLSTLGDSGDGEAILTATSVTTDSYLVDPSGVVYDSATRAPIAKAGITLVRQSCKNTAVSPITAAEIYNGSSGAYTYNADGSVSMSTDSNGGYEFYWRVPPVADLCTYGISVAPPSGSTYLSPSVKIPAQTGSFTTCGNVVANEGAPAVGADTTYYNTFVSGYDSSAGAVCEVMHNNLPLDSAAALGTTILLKKEANKSVAEFGDFVDYKLTASNMGTATLTGVSFTDNLPPGLTYVKGSAVFNNARVADPAGNGQQLSFSFPSFNVVPKAGVSLQFRVRIGVGAPTGGDVVNRASAVVNNVASNQAEYKLHVAGGAFADDAYAFGKVFLDCDQNGVQNGATELGIPGVRLYLENGTSVVTDAEGRWSLYGLKPITHVVRVDTDTLPAGAQLGLWDNRNALAPDSRFLDTKKGEFAKADFVVTNCADPALTAEVEKRRKAAASDLNKALNSAMAARLATDNAPTAAPKVNDLRGQAATGGVALDNTQAAAGAVAARALIALPGGTGAIGATGGTAPLTPVADAGSATAPSSAHPSPQTRAGGADMLGKLPAASVVPLEDRMRDIDPAIGLIDLKDGDTVPTRSINLRVKGPYDTSLRVSVDGVDVPEKRVGKKACLESKQICAWEYFGVELKAGPNKVAVRAEDALGVAREHAELTLIAPDNLGRIKIDPPDAHRTDVRTPVEIVVHLTDAAGVPVTARAQATLETDRGRWLENDLNPDLPGTQVVMNGGQASFRLLPPEEPGPVRVRVTVNELQEEIVFDALPVMQRMQGIGIVEGTLDFTKRGNIALGQNPAGSAFETELSGISHQGDDVRAAARSAFYFKGTIKGEYLLTTALDSDKTTKDRLFRDVNPNDYYPVYGDDSARGYDAASTQKLYVRVDKNRSYLLYGDFTTASSTEVRSLSQVSRTLTGLKHQYAGDDARMTSFVSRTSTQQQVEEIRATGLSFYYLSGTADIVAGSDKVELIVRSAAQPQIVLSSKTLTAYTDYTLETATRRLLFVNPIASFDADLNPQSIRVTYEVDGGGDAYYVGGTDAQFKLGERVQAGVVAMKDDNPENQHRSLQAVTALTRVGDATVVAAEAVRTSADDKGDGHGARIEVRHDSGALKAQAQAVRTDNNFENPSASMAAGRTEVTARAEYQIDPDTRLRAEAIGSRTESGGTAAASRDSVSVAVQHKLGDTMVGEVGLRRGNDNGGGAGSFDYGQTMGTANLMTTGSAAESNTSVRARLTARPPQISGAEVFAEAEQDIDRGDARALGVGGAYALDAKTRLYARREYLFGPLADESRGGQINATVMGVESAYMEGGRVYDEYRADLLGRGQNATGLRNSFTLAPGLKLTTGAEHTRSVGSSTDGSTAVNLGVDYTTDAWRTSVALENRNGDADSRLVSAAVAYRFNRDWSFLTRSINTWTDGSSSGAHDLQRQQFGLAWRPAENDSINGLLRLETRREYIGSTASGSSSPYSLYGSSGSALPGTYRTDILTGLVNFNPARGTQVNARYAVKRAMVDTPPLDTSRAWAQLVYGRVTQDIAARWDIGLQAGYLRGSDDAQQRMAGVEAGYQLAKNLWVSAGYNVLGVRDADLTGADYTSKGGYMRLRMKFDEGLFGFDADKAADPALTAAAKPTPAAAPATSAGWTPGQPIGGRVDLAAVQLFVSPEATTLMPRGLELVRALAKQLKPEGTTSVLISAGYVDSAPVRDGVWLKRANTVRRALQAAWHGPVTVERAAQALGAPVADPQEPLIVTISGEGIPVPPPPAAAPGWAAGQPAGGRADLGAAQLFNDRDVAALTPRGRDLVRALAKQLKTEGAQTVLVSAGYGDAAPARDGVWLQRAAAVRRVLQAELRLPVSVERAAQALGARDADTETPEHPTITVSGEGVPLPLPALTAAR